jgi:hypothetical protein
MPYASGSVHPFDTDRKIFQYLARVKHLTRLKTCHFFSEAYCFSHQASLAPLVCVTKSGIPD